MGLLNALGMMAGGAASAYGKAATESYAEQIKQIALQAREENMARINDQYASKRQETQNKFVSDENMVNRAAEFTKEREREESALKREDRQFGHAETLQKASIESGEKLAKEARDSREWEVVTGRLWASAERKESQQYKTDLVYLENSLQRDLEKEKFGRSKDLAKFINGFDKVGVMGQAYADVARVLGKDEAVKFFKDKLLKDVGDDRARDAVLGALIKGASDGGEPLTPDRLATFITAADTAARKAKGGKPSPVVADPIDRAISARAGQTATAPELTPKPKEAEPPFMGIIPQVAPPLTPEEIAAEKAADEQARMGRRGLLRSRYGGSN